MPQNLKEYYASNGAALPSVAERTPLATAAGISNYTGTAEQNTTLLGFLTNGGKAPAPVNTGGGTSTPTSTPSTSSGLGTDSFLEALKEKLINNAGAISSADTGLETKIKEAIDQTKSGNTASKSYIESTYGRQIDEATKQGQDAVTAFAESQRGFGINTAAAKAVTDAAEKRVKDLEQRKQELILAGDAQTAGQISNLIMKELEFEQNARIHTFSNLLNIGNFALKALETKSTLSTANAPKASDIETFTDEKGNVTAKNKLTGQTLWTAKVGRSGSASANYQITPIANPTTGTVEYTQIKDPKTGEVKYYDNSGAEVDPSKVQINKPADPLDTIINDVLSEISTEISQ